MPHWQSYSFIPIAAETMGAINGDGIEFLGELGRRITRITDDKRESTFLFQRMSVVIQRYNAVAIQGTFAPRTTSSRSSISFAFSEDPEG